MCGFGEKLCFKAVGLWRLRLDSVDDINAALP